MKVLSVVSMLCVLIISAYGYSSAAEKEDSQIPTVTFRLRDVKMDEIMKGVSKQVGYTVQIEGEFKDDLVSGKYTNVSLDKFFHRIFKHRNVVVDIDTNQKKVFVYLFNGTLRKEYVKFQAKDDQDSNLPLSNVSLSELDEIFAEEEQIYQSWKKDPNATIPFTSMTQAEFQEISDQEAEDYQQRMQDPKTKVPLSDLTQSEAKAILEQDVHEQQVRSQDPNEKIVFSNMTKSEFKARIEEEGRRYQRVKNDPDALIPFSNVTNSEFHSKNDQ